MILNLAHRQDRKAYMLSQPHLAACSFFPAVQIDDLDSGLALYARQPWTRIVEHRFTLERKRGLLGVYASHIRILEGLQVRTGRHGSNLCAGAYHYTRIPISVSMKCHSRSGISPRRPRRRGASA